MNALFNRKDQQMEFLIPPKENDSAIEIREQIRAALYSPDAKPGAVIQSKSTSKPVYNEAVCAFIVCVFLSIITIETDKIVVTKCSIIQ